MQTKNKTFHERNAAALKRLLAPERELFARLCRIAAKLGVSVIQLRTWPQAWVGATGIYAPARTRGDRELFRGRHANPPCIFLRFGDPFVLAHEISHHVSMFDTMIDARTGREVSSLLARLCQCHGIRYYGQTETVRLAEIRAECLCRRLLCLPLPVTLRRFTARAWAELERAL